jgi:intein/homing endonuclease
MVNGTHLIEFYRQHPCIAAYELLGVDLAPIQRMVFRDMWFKNYVIAVCSRGFGKTYLLGVLSALSCLLYPGYRVGLIGPVFRQCLTIFPTGSGIYDTFWTNSGLQVGTSNFYNSIVEEKTKIQSICSYNTIKNKWINEERECVLIDTEKGFHLSGTTDHRVLTLLEDMTLDYKKLSDISNDDYLAIRKGFRLFGDNVNIDNYSIIKNYDRYMNDIKLPNTLDEDLSYMLGLLVGDGWLESEETKNRFWSVGFCSNDKQIIDKYKKILFNSFGINEDRINIKFDGNLYRIEIYSIVLWNFFKNLGMSSTTAIDKKVPYIIRGTNEHNIKAFLRGVFDTDGSCYVSQSKMSKSCTIEYVSISKRLCKEIQSILLNLGVVSSFSIKSKEKKTFFKNTGKFHDCKECYRIRVTGTDNIMLFSDEVNFGLDRKSNLLLSYIKSLTKEDFNNSIPMSFKSVWSLAEKCRVLDTENIYGIDWYLNKHKKHRRSNYSVGRIRKLLFIAEQLGVLCDDFDKLKYLIDNDFYFVKPKNIKKFFAKTIDIEVENEHCYWANGFINHNSKMIFSEVEKLYDQSSILREATSKKPTRGSDTCYLKFKAVAGKTPSYVEALPLSDGSKIRGSRFYLIAMDELAQIPDQVIDMVVRPMGATSMAPMERVRKLEEQKRLIDSGLATAEDFLEEKVNKMVMTSSGYYKFNHMWRRMKDHWKMVDDAEKIGDKSPYSVWQVPYWDLPEGFLDKANIAEAKRIMNQHEFSMEYEAMMVSDSEGFFKASLLEECTNGSGFTLNFTGESSKRYVVGVDPNQGGSASCGVVIIEVGAVNKIINIIEAKSKTTQQLTKLIQEICNNYNVIRVFVDRGGGGKAVMDLLEEGYNGEEPIIDRTNPDNKHLEGRHILEMVNFNPAWISDANFTTKSMLEDKRLKFPELDIGADDLLSKRYDNVRTLKSQMLSIIVTQTATGILHFDTPTKNMNKDLYSALILAAHGARQIERELEEEDDNILYQDGGLIRYRDGGNNFSNFSSKSLIMNEKVLNSSYFGAAVLKKKPK